MTTTQQCRTCGASVRRGEAIIRSEMFVQVAYCSDCWDAEAMVPRPRRSPEQMESIEPSTGRSET